MDQIPMKTPTLGIITIICLIAQATIAPHLAIGGCTPLFLVIPLILICWHSGATFGVIFGFLLGLLYDMGSGQTIGALALGCAIAAFVFSMLSRGGSWLIPAIVSVVIIEFVQGVLICATGFEASFGSVFVHRILGGSIYSIIITVVVLAILKLVLGRKRNPVGPSRRIR